PDDPEFGFGASVAKLAGDGSDVFYVICTDGCQGGEDPTVPDAELSAIRYAEQRAAAEVLGVKDVVFLGFRDGYLAPNVELRKAITREIRRFKPDLVLTHLPVRTLGVGIGASHPDHLAVGEATLSAVYPDSRNPRAYPELLDEGLATHRVKEVWLPGMDQADHFVDATGLVEKKLEAIGCHRSQFEKPGSNPDEMRKWITERMRLVGEKAGFEYAEGFRKLQTG
ncbi:MAG TPA: PIG-L deacetylase family protein, partial [Candidatus Dormibacteraeota bacterium]|nr:PIG-L deacetylase family protein [Candidatus Dormibacteraeota bacterium]